MLAKMPDVSGKSFLMPAEIGQENDKTPMELVENSRRLVVKGKGAIYGSR
jgi:hypothetical protein